MLNCSNNRYEREFGSIGSRKEDVRKMFLLKKGWKEIRKNFPKTFRRQEAVILASVLGISVICSAFVVNANYQTRKESVTEETLSETLILGTENHITTNTLEKKALEFPKFEVTVVQSRKGDVITPVRSAYTMEDRELLAQMMYAEEGVFFSWAAGDPEKIERVKGIPSSKHLAERSEYFRQKVWALKQRALGVAEPPVLPVAAETPEEVQA